MLGFDFEATNNNAARLFIGFIPRGFAAIRAARRNGKVTNLLGDVFVTNTVWRERRIALK